MVVEENKIDYTEIINMIREGIAYVIDNDDMSLYNDIDVMITNEQFFIRQREEGTLYNNTIYMVIKFGSATVDYGVTVVPISIIAISEQNHCDLAQRLLQDFTTMANMGFNNTESIQQFYESPAVTSNFNEMYEGFRSVLTVPGSFVISASANPFTLSWYNDDPNADLDEEHRWEDVHFITGNIDANFQTDPKLFYDSNNYTRSIDTMGTVMFDISSVLLSDNSFYDKMIDFIAKKNNYTIDLDPYDYEKDEYGQPILNNNGEKIRIYDENQQIVKNPNWLKKIQKEIKDGADINMNIIFKIRFKKSGQELVDYFKIASEKIQQVLKKIPMITLVFTN